MRATKLVISIKSWSSLKPGPSRPGPLALKPSRPGLKSGPATKVWKAGDSWWKATGVGYYVIMSSCAVALSTHRAILLPR